MSSRSKTTYHGMQLKRVQRSEFDDTRLREHTRHDARLDEHMKTVDRAKNVILKSLDADKQMFLRTGAQGNTKMTKSSIRPQLRPSPTSDTQSSRLVSDSRLQKYGQSETDGPIHHYNDHLMVTSLSGNANRLRTPKVSDTSDHTTTTSASSSPTSGKEESIFEAGSVYDQFFQANTKKSGAKKPPKSTSASESESRLSKGNKDTKLDPASAQSQTSKHKSASSGAKSTADQSTGGKGSTRSDTNRQMNKHTDDTGVEARKSRNVWDNLSVPKHTASARSKRSELEREFSSTHISPRGGGSSSNKVTDQSSSNGKTARARVKSGVSKAASPGAGSHKKESVH